MVCINVWCSVLFGVRGGIYSSVFYWFILYMKVTLLLATAKTAKNIYFQI